MEGIKLRNGKIFYYVGLVILLILLIGLVVSLIAFREFLSHRILPFTLLFLFTIGAIYSDYLERKIKRKRYDSMLKNISKLNKQDLISMVKELFKRSGYKFKKVKNNDYEFKLLRGRNKYIFTIGKAKPVFTVQDPKYKRIHLYMGYKNDSIKGSGNLIILDFNDLKTIVDRVI